MIDSHAHLYFDAFDADRSEAIRRAREAGVRRAINIGTDLESSRKAVALALGEEEFYAAVGLHPTTPEADVEGVLSGIERLARENPGRVVAIGEIGLDYHWHDVPRDEQASRLALQLDLAVRLELPVVLHCREALEDLFALLESRPVRPRGVFHCFSGGPREADRAVALGFHVSFAGNVTFPKAPELRAAARGVPLERLLIETDCPFLAPQARRGKRNEPAYLVHVLECLAKERGLGLEELDRATELAAETLFGLPALPVPGASGSIR